MFICYYCKSFYLWCVYVIFRNKIVLMIYFYVFLIVKGYFFLKVVNFLFIKKLLFLI